MTSSIRIETEFEIFDSTSTDGLIKKCFNIFDIPYFTIKKNQLFLDGTLIGERKSEEEIANTSKQSSSGSFVVKDLAIIVNNWIESNTEKESHES